MRLDIREPSPGVRKKAEPGVAKSRPRDFRKLNEGFQRAEPGVSGSRVGIQRA